MKFIDNNFIPRTVYKKNVTITKMHVKRDVKPTDDRFFMILYIYRYISQIIIQKVPKRSIKENH